MKFRRLAPIAAILLTLVVAVGTLVRVVTDPGRVLFEFVLLVIMVGAGWIALTRAGARRTIAVVVAVAAVVALLVSIVNAEGFLGLSLDLRISALVPARRAAPDWSSACAGARGRSSASSPLPQTRS